MKDLRHTYPLTAFNNFFSKNFKGSRVIILTDENTRKHCLPHFLDVCNTISNPHIVEIKSGEEQKNINTYIAVMESLTEFHADRKALLINLGGGVICDLGGFVAATYKRGISFINIPTTLLAMADAAIGGKTGIDFAHYKNQIGVFSDAAAIFTDINFLSTLSNEQILSGFSEIIKTALITSSELWETVKRTDIKDYGRLEPLVFEVARRKADIVNEDPKEQGLRQILNFGHTFGHAFESLSLKENRTISHGHAVAMGMICELILSVRLLGMNEKDKNEIVSFILANYPYFTLEENDKTIITSLIKQDKKNKYGDVRMVLLKAAGQAVYDESCSEALIAEALNEYTKLKA